MLTFNLVWPSFALLKLSSWYRAVRFEVESSSGTLHVRNSAWSQVVFKIYHVLSVLKLIQCSVSAVRLFQSEELTSESIQNIVLLASMSSMYSTAIVWSSQYGSAADFVILLTPLRKINLDRANQVDGHGQDVITSGRHKTISNKFARQCHQLKDYLGATRSDFVRNLSTFSIHDFLTIIVPIVVPAFLPVFYAIIIIGQPRDILMISLLTTQWLQFWAMEAAAILFDLILLTFVNMTFSIGFLILCGTWAMALRQIRDLDKRLRFPTAGMMSSRRKRQPIWMQIRQLSCTVNMLNISAGKSFYMGKLMTFSCCVLGTFYILRFGLTDVMSFTMALLAVEGIMFYVACMGKAYLLTDTMDDVLRNIKLISQYYSGDSKREMRQMIQSVRVLAMNESGFRPMTRETTTEFIDFYLNQVIGLLLAF